MSAPDDRLEFDLVERGALLVPCPLVSRGRPRYDANGPLPPNTGRLLYRAAAGEGVEPWLAVHAGVGPARLLVSWRAPRPDRGIDTGIGNDRDIDGDRHGGGASLESSPPTSYRIETSANSARGADGDYRVELRVADTAAHARAHVIEFDGQSWVRLTFEGSASGRSIGLDRVDLHDVSDGTDDVWLILGDELAQQAFTPADGAAGVADLIHERYPGYYPALIDETRAGEAPAATLERVLALLELHPYARHVALAYGASSLAAGAEHSGSPIGAALATLVGTLVEHGCTVLLARTRALGARSAAAGVQRAITELEARRALVPGPDLNAWFEAHPEQLGVDGAPTSEGRAATQRLWLEALDVLYVPQ